MKTTVSKGGKISMTAENKKDSLDLLKFMYKCAGSDDEDMAKRIKKKEEELAKG